MVEDFLSNGAMINQDTPRRNLPRVSLDTDAGAFQHFAHGNNSGMIKNKTTMMIECDF